MTDAMTRPRSGRPSRYAAMLGLLALTTASACGRDDRGRSGPSGATDGGTTVDGGSPVGMIGPVQGFVPATHGFPFQNYTNQNGGVTNLTAVEMRRIYGDAVCGSFSGEACILKPTAKQWMDGINGAMNGGHCEGMAVLSLLMYQGIAPAMAFGGAQAGALTLDGNEQLQREIAYWFSLQVPTAMARIAGSPTEQLDRLRASFADGATDNYTVAFFKRDNTGGHAVTPFGLREVDEATTHILIYDNNFPGEERHIEVNRATNTWRYSAAASPDVAESVYEGDATSGNLQLVPLSVRFGTHPCTFCGNYQASATAPMARMVSVIGDGDALIMDESEHRLGTVDGAFVNEIPGARAIGLVSDDLWNDDQDPLYEIPSGSALQVSLLGADLRGPTESSVSVAGPGYVIGVDEVILDPGQEDLLELGRDTAEIYYETQATETATVFIALETEQSDWLFQVRSGGEAGGQAIVAAADLSEGVLGFGFLADDEYTTFDLYIERHDDTGVLEFVNRGIEVPNGAVLEVVFVNWDEDGEGLVLLIDLDGDGNPDAELALTDEG